MISCSHYTRFIGNKRVTSAGAVKYLQQKLDLTKWHMRGASAGALVACLAACNVDPQYAYEVAHRYEILSIF